MQLKSVKLVTLHATASELNDRPYSAVVTNYRLGVDLYTSRLHWSRTAECTVGLRPRCKFRIGSQGRGGPTCYRENMGAFPSTWMEQQSILVHFLQANTIPIWAGRRSIQPIATRAHPPLCLPLASGLAKFAPLQTRPCFCSAFAPIIHVLLWKR